MGRAAIISRSQRARRAGATLGVVGLLLSVLTLSLPASTPASAHTVGAPGENDVYAGTWPPSSHAAWQRPATNPAISQSCGLDIGILIDRSGSIADAGKATEMRESAKALVDTLAGTPSAVGVWSFGNDSSATGTTEHPARQLTEVGGVNGPIGVAALKATIDSIPIVSRVATNWEAGFGAVHTASTMPGNRAPDLLFVLTDGKPTVHIDDASTGGTTNNDDVDGGIRTANLVKSLGTRIFAVGIGAGIDATTLALIANNLAFNGSNITTAGYALTNFDDLKTTLRQLATALCGGSVTVQKLADPGNGIFSPAAGWEFTLDPTNAEIPNQTKTTDDKGQANFDLTSFATEQVTLTENLGAKPGYQFLAKELVCTNSNGAAPTLTPVTNGVRFDLGPTDIVSCTFKNRKQFVDLGIVKTDGGVSTVPGAMVTYTLTYGNKGNVAAPDTVLTETVPVNTTVDLGSGPADGKNDGWVCNGLESGSFPSGTTCTHAVGTIAAGASGLTVTFTVTVNNPVPYGTTQITNTALISYDNSKGPDSNPSDNSSTDTTPVVVTPGLTVVKTAVLQGQLCPGVDGTTLTIVAGQSVVYCYTVSNPATGALLNVSLVDDNGTPGNPGDDFTVALSGLTDQDGDTQVDDLAAGASATGQSAPKTFGTVGTITNVATARGATIEATDDAVVKVTRPKVNVVKTAVKQGQSCPGADGVTLTIVAGQAVVYCYVVSNPGSAPLLDVSLVDDNGTPGDPGDDFTVALSGLTDQDGDTQADDLAAGASATGQSSPKTFGSTGSVTNVATASGLSASRQRLSDTDDAVVAVTRPQVNVVKTAVKEGQACPGTDGVTLVVNEGQRVRYCYAVTNSGDAPLLNLVVRDDNGTPLDLGDDFTVALSGLTDQDGDTQADDLAAGDTATGVSSLVGFEPGTVMNVATASGSSGSGEQLSDTDTAVVRVDDIGPTVEVTKSADPSSVAEPGAPVTFTVKVKNTSSEPVTITSITDSVEGGSPFSVTSVASPVTATTCSTGVSIAPGATYTCTFTLEVSGNAGDVVDDVVTAVVVDNDGTQASDDDDASVRITDVPPTIVVTKTADVTSVAEPGGPVSFTVELRNTSSEPVTITSITDSVEGGSPFSVTSVASPVTATTCSTGVSIAPGATYTCTFTLEVSGNAGDLVTDTVVGAVVDDDGTSVSDDDDASVEITDVPPTIVVTKDDGGVSVAAPGGEVTYTVSIENTSREAVTVTSITDSVDGGAPFDVTSPAVDPVLATTCETGVSIEPGGIYTCEFTVRVDGSGGETVTDTVVATVVDDDDATATDGDDEQTPVTPVADLAIVKETPSATFTVGQQATYTLRVTNNGPSIATNVIVTDSLPAGLSFVSIDPPAGWTCSGTATITCTVPSLTVGATAEITLVVLVGPEAEPSVTNAAEVSGDEPDDDPSNNRDEVTTPVVAVAGVAQVRPQVQAATLPRTGLDLARWVGFGLLLSGAGLFLVAVDRRRRA